VSSDTKTAVESAWKTGTVVPGFNIPYLPMMEPVVSALRDTDSFGLIMVARLEWIKFESKSLKAIRDEYEKVKDTRHTRLHLDHVPVIDEDNKKVDCLAVIKEALELGYESVMVDGSRLPLAENIEITRKATHLAHSAAVPAEAELGAVMGHESGPMPSYEELFASGKGFTDPDEAAKFVKETGVDWLSVAIGNVHGAISAATKDNKKISARLNIDHLAKINAKTNVPLVLHGGTGISPELIRQGVKNGIAKVNIATAIRQPYERAVKISAGAARKAVYDTMIDIIKNELCIAGNSKLILKQARVL
jgi:fructose-bisphosphate aldolase class II